VANLPVEFSVDVVGEVTGETFKGVFKAVPRLSHRDNLRRDQLRRDLLGSKPEDASVDATNVSAVFSKLWVHLVEFPSWWKDSKNGLELLDETPVAAVYDNVARIEREAIEAIQKKAQAQVEAVAEEAAKKP
jgi:hypothetical protein